MYFQNSGVVGEGEVLDFPAKPKALMERPRSSSVVRFGTYEVSLQSGEVRKAGLRIRVQQQPLKLLENC